MKINKLNKALGGFFCLTALLISSTSIAEEESAVDSYSVNGWSYEVAFSEEFPATLKSLINADLALYLRKSSEDDVLPLATYLNLLYSELDIVGSEKLTTAQMDQLFNLTFSLEEKQLNAQQQVKQVTELSDFLSDMQSKLLDRYQPFDGCRFSSNVDVDESTKTASANFFYEPLLDEDGVEVSCQESYEFAQETKAQDDEERNIWVNHIRISVAESLDEAIDPILAINAKNFLEEERRKATKYSVNGVEGFDEFDLLRLVDDVSKFYYSTSGGTKVSDRKMQDFMRQLLQPRSGRGVSFDELSLIADELKSFYRRNGLILTRIFIPEQDFSGAWGEIEFSVVLGILDKVEVRNADEIHYKPSVVTSAFDKYIGKSVSANIGEAYFYLNDMPGLSIQSGLFEPGDEDGETNLYINVKEKRWSLTVLADNYGTELTGENRLITTVDWINPSGYGDFLKAGFLYTSSPSNATLGFLNYRVPLIPTRLDFSIGADTNIYEAQQTIAGTTPVIIEGETLNFFSGVNWKIKRSKDENMSLAANLFSKSSEIDTSLIFVTAANAGSSKETANGLQVTFASDFLSRALRSASNYDISFSGASVDYDNTNTNVQAALDEHSSFVKIAANFNSITLIPLSKIHRSKFQAKLKTQYSSDVLPSFEQFSLGGPYAVKAFTTSAFVADTAAYVNVGWDFNLLDVITSKRLREHILDFGVFYEGAYGELNPVTEEDGDESVALSGYGLYMRYDWNRALVLDASLSFPAVASEDGGAFISEDDKEREENGDHEFLISLRYTFN